LPRRAFVTTDKAVLRAHIRTARDTFVARKPPAIEAPEQFRAMLKPGLTITSYVPVGSEADPTLLARAAVAAGCVIALPHVTTRAEPMRFLAWATEAALVAGPFGLQQPAADAAVLVPDIILTPLLAFDSKLDRLGQGAGYYDRAFAEFPAARRIGVAWDVQRVETLPVDPWDMRLDAVITESGWTTAL
jgi:5-formyltetrahydrofolate cyclo-ligase